MEIHLKAPVIENVHLDRGYAPRREQIKPGHHPKCAHFILPSKKDFVVVVAVAAWCIRLIFKKTGQRTYSNPSHRHIKQHTESFGYQFCCDFAQSETINCL